MGLSMGAIGDEKPRGHLGKEKKPPKKNLGESDQLGGLIKQQEVAITVPLSGGTELNQAQINEKGGSNQIKPVTHLQPSF